MEPIPKPLLRRLVLTFLVGAGCFFTGLVFFLHERDTSFFILSILLFAGSAAKAILLGLQIKRKTYFVLEGICTDVRLRLFRNSHDIVLTDRMVMNTCSGSARTTRSVPVFPTGFISRLQTVSRPGKIRS